MFGNGEPDDELPSFFGSGGHVPDGVGSLIGELEEAGVLTGPDDDDENSEMNRETFGAATMDEARDEYSQVAFGGGGGGGGGGGAEEEAFTDLRDLEDSLLKVLEGPPSPARPKPPPPPLRPPPRGLPPQQPQPPQQQPPQPPQPPPGVSMSPVPSLPPVFSPQQQHMAAHFAAFQQQQQAYYNQLQQQQLHLQQQHFQQQHMRLLAQQHQHQHQQSGQQQPPPPVFLGVEAKPQGAWANKAPPPLPAPPAPPPPGMQGAGAPGAAPPGMMVPVGIDPATGRTVFVHPSQLSPSAPAPPPGAPPLPPPQQQRPPHPAGAAPPTRSNKSQAAPKNQPGSKNPPSGGKGPSSGKGNTGKAGSSPVGVMGYHSASSSWAPWPPPQHPIRGKFMSKRDVASVLFVHRRSLEISDPYSEDYYYHHFKLKEQARAQSEVLGGGHMPKPASTNQVPLPAWAETKHAALSAKTELWGKFAEGSKDWKEKNQVFGSTQKSNPHRPKALVSVPTGSTSAEANKAVDDKEAAAAAAEAASDEEDGEEIFIGGGASAAALRPLNGATEAPFSSKAWGARKAVESAKIALLAIDEQRQLLQRPDLTPEQATKVHAGLAEQFAHLQASLGFLPGQTEAVNDVELLASICGSNKGKRLVAKAFALLPQFAPALLPTVLRVLIARPPPAASDNEADPFANAETRDAEDALATAMLTAMGAPPPPSGDGGAEVAAAAAADPRRHPFPFSAAKASLESAMGPHVRGTTLHRCLQSKGRSDVVQNLLRQGDALSSKEPPEAQAYWRQLKGAFMTLAKQTSSPSARESADSKV